jgi:selenocysteine-specific elongation factor
MPRFKPEVIKTLNVREKGSPEDLVVARLAAKKWLEMGDLLTQIALSSEDVKPFMEGLVARGEIIQLGQGEHSLLMSLDARNNLSHDTKKTLQEYHSKFPARIGMPKVELLNKLKLGKYGQLLLERLVTDKSLIDEGTVVYLPGFQIKISAVQQAKIDMFLKALIENPYAPPTELIPDPDILNLLLDRKQVVKLSEGVVVSTKAYSEMVDKILTRLTANGKITLAEVRDMFQTSRKYAQALLEHLDAEKVTRRVGDERVKY